MNTKSSIQEQQEEESEFESQRPETIHKEDDGAETRNSFNEGYYEKFFVEQQKLGRGFRGSVFHCIHMLDGVQLGTFAVKKIPVGKFFV